MLGHISVMSFPGAVAIPRSWITLATLLLLSNIPQAPQTTPRTNTDKQESHIKRGHPIVFGLILFFALIEGCITAWLGESLLCLTWDDTDEQYPDSTLTTTTPTALTETESVSYFSSLGGLLFSPLDTSLSSSSTLDLSSFPSLPTVSSLLSRKSTVALTGAFLLSCSNGANLLVGSSGLPVLLPTLPLLMVETVHPTV
jgi:hypothetical protein